MVMVRCPKVDKAVPTGVRCDISAFSGLSMRKQFTCPACGQRHKWSIEDAWLRDAAYATNEPKLLLLTA
jgi:hypothetical protein